MLCEWKPTIDQSDYIVLVVDRDQIDNQEVEMQAVYAARTGKKILAMIESPGQPAQYMLNLPGFMWEGFVSNSESSFKSGLARLIARHRDKTDQDKTFDGPPYKFICFCAPSKLPDFLQSEDRAKR